MDLITAILKDADELIVINLEQMVIAMPRRDGWEEKDQVYTSFLMTSSLPHTATIETMLPYEQFLDTMGVDKPVEPEPVRVQTVEHGLWIEGATCILHDTVHDDNGWYVCVDGGIINKTGFHPNEE